MFFSVFSLFLSIDVLSALVFICLVLSSRQVSSSCFNPETSSRVTLASLGIAFQANLIR